MSSNASTSILLLILLLLLHFSAQNNDIIFAASTPVTGPSADLGNIVFGVQAAFLECNLKGGIGGRNITLIVEDDKYEPALALQNTQRFLNRTDIFGFIGFVGTSASALILPLIKEKEIPYIGPLTGSNVVRDPWNYYTVNIRASYDDEIACMVNYLVNIREIRTISLLYQADGFGQAGYDAAVKAMAVFGLTLTTTATYARNTLDVESGASIISRGNPEAIIMVGTSRALAKFVKIVKQTYPNGNTILFLTLSVVSPVVFAKALDSHENVIITQIVPPYDDHTYRISKEYANAMQMYNPSLPLEFMSMEGYVGARVAIAALMQSNGSSRSSFLRTVYELAEFAIGGIVVGPYQKCTSSPVTTDCGCNQGIRRVWPTYITPNMTFEVISEAMLSWTTCKVDSSTISVPLMFGQSAALSGPAGYQGEQMQAGIKVAFQEYNALGGFMKRKVQLLTMDDKYEPEPSLINTQSLLLNSSVFGLVGYIGTANSFAALNWMKSHYGVVADSIPFIAPLSGSMDLRKPFRRNVIHVRSSYDDEVAAMVNFLLNEKQVQRISLLLQDDPFGYAVKAGLQRALDAVGLGIMSEGHYARNTMDVEGALESITQLQPQAIIMTGPYGPLAKFIQLAKNSSRLVDRRNTIFMAISFCGSYELAATLPHKDAQNVYVTEVVPHPSDSKQQIVTYFLRAMAKFAPQVAISTVALEGYLAGRLITEVLRRFVIINSSATSFSREDFLNTLYEVGDFSSAGASVKGFVDDCSADECCNQGMKEVSIVEIKSGNLTLVSDDKFSFATCVVDVNQALSFPYYFSLVGTDISQKTSLSYHFARGVRDAFKAINLKRTSRKVQLITYDDSGSTSELERLLKFTVENDNVVGLIGLDADSLRIPSTHPMSNYTVIAPQTGDLYLRKPYKQNIINIRATLLDEVAALLYAFASIKRVYSVLVIYDRHDPRWNLLLSDTLNYLTLSLEIHGYYLEHSDPQLDVFYANNEFDCVLLLSNATLITEVLMKVALSKPTIPFGITFDGDVSSVLGNLQNYKGILAGLQGRLFTTNPVIDFTSVSQTLTNCSVSAYRAKTSYAEGLVAGYVAASPMARESTKIITKESLLTSLYETGVFIVQNNVYGPLGTPCKTKDVCSGSSVCDCNQLSRKVQVMALADSSSMVLSAIAAAFTMGTCGVVIPDYQFPIAWLIVIIVVAVVIICVVILVVIILAIVLSRKASLKYAPPTGNIVIGFTDVQSSTQLWEENPKEMQKALKIHNYVVRKMLKKYKGYEVKTIGDSFMVTFSNPVNAMYWAIETQLELLHSNWPKRLVGMYNCRMEWDSQQRIVFKGLRIRIGLHFGHAERQYDAVTKRYDYFGTSINKAARIESLAKGGQVLISKEFFREVYTFLERHGTDLDTSSNISELFLVPPAGERRKSIFGGADQQTVNPGSSPALTVSGSGRRDSFRSRSSGSSSSLQAAIIHKQWLSQSVLGGLSGLPFPVLYKTEGTFELKGLQEKELLLEITCEQLSTRKYDTAVANTIAPAAAASDIPKLETTASTTSIIKRKKRVAPAPGSDFSDILNPTNAEEHETKQEEPAT